MMNHRAPIASCCCSHCCDRRRRRRPILVPMPLRLRFMSLATLCALHLATGFGTSPQCSLVLTSRSEYLGRAGLPVLERTIRAFGTRQLLASKDSEDDLDAAAAANGDDDDGDDRDDDDEAEEIKPYGNRSLAWTKRYRRLNPYEKCRARVLRFGHRSKEDWDEAAASGQLGQYVPNRPDEMYAPEWESWEEFLGLMRSYEDTRNLAVHVLGLKTFDDYILFVRGNPKRAEGLRIPVRPDVFYKEEWVDEDTFFFSSS